MTGIFGTRPAGGSLSAGALGKTWKILKSAPGIAGWWLDLTRSLETLPVLTWSASVWSGRSSSAFGSGGVSCKSFLNAACNGEDARRIEWIWLSFEGFGTFFAPGSAWCSFGWFWLIFGDAGWRRAAVRDLICGFGSLGSAFGFLWRIGSGGGFLFGSRSWRRLSLGLRDREGMAGGVCGCWSLARVFGRSRQDASFSFLLIFWFYF